MWPVRRIPGTVYVSSTTAPVSQPVHFLRAFVNVALHKFNNVLNAQGFGWEIAQISTSAQAIF